MFVQALNVGFGSTWPWVSEWTNDANRGVVSHPGYALPEKEVLIDEDTGAVTENPFVLGQTPLQRLVLDNRIGRVFANDTKGTKEVMKIAQKREKQFLDGVKKTMKDPEAPRDPTRNWSKEQHFPLSETMLHLQREVIKTATKDANDQYDDVNTDDCNIACLLSVNKTLTNEDAMRLSALFQIVAFFQDEAQIHFVGEKIHPTMTTNWLAQVHFYRVLDWILFDEFNSDGTFKDPAKNSTNYALQHVKEVLYPPGAMMTLNNQKKKGIENNAMYKALFKPGSWERLINALRLIGIERGEDGHMARTTDQNKMVQPPEEPNPFPEAIDAYFPPKEMLSPDMEKQWEWMHYNERKMPFGPKLKWVSPIPECEYRMELNDVTNWRKVSSAFLLCVTLDAIREEERRGEVKQPKETDFPSGKREARLEKSKGVLRKLSLNVHYNLVLPDPREEGIKTLRRETLFNNCLLDYALSQPHMQLCRTARGMMLTKKQWDTVNSLKDIAKSNAAQLFHPNAFTRVNMVRVHTPPPVTRTAVALIRDFELQGWLKKLDGVFVQSFYIWDCRLMENCVYYAQVATVFHAFRQRLLDGHGYKKKHTFKREARISKAKNAKKRDTRAKTYDGGTSEEGTDEAVEGAPLDYLGNRLDNQASATAKEDKEKHPEDKSDASSHEEEDPELLKKAEGEAESEPEGEEGSKPDTKNEGSLARSDLREFHEEVFETSSNEEPDSEDSGPDKFDGKDEEEPDESDTEFCKPDGDPESEEGDPSDGERYVEEGSDDADDEDSSDDSSEDEAEDEAEAEAEAEEGPPSKKQRLAGPTTQAKLKKPDGGSA